ncbi:hypothetical protein [Lacinutrix chionoecetis]
MKKYYFKFSLVVITFFLMTNCKNDKKMTTYTKTPMNQINVCSTKNEDLNLNFILEHINTIEGEACLNKVLDFVKSNFTKSPNTSIKIIETLIKNHEYEYLLDYSNELFIEQPKLFLNYFGDNKNSNILNALKELYGYSIPEYNKKTYQKIEKKANLTNEDKEILKSINPNLTSSK